MADGLFDKMKRVIGIDEDEADYDEYYEDRFEESDAERQSSSPSYADRSSDFVQPKIDPASKVVSMQNASANVSAKRQQMKMLITEPKTFNDCPKLVDSLRDNRPVIINVEQLEREIARKIFDFLSGATYAISGKVQKVSENIFVFAPANVDIMAFISDSEESQQSSADNTYMRDIPWRR